VKLRTSNTPRNSIECANLGEPNKGPPGKGRPEGSPRKSLKTEEHATGRLSMHASTYVTQKLSGGPCRYASPAAAVARRWKCAGCAIRSACCQTTLSTIL